MSEDTSSAIEAYDDSSTSKVTLASVIETGDATARTKAIRITGNNIANTILGGTGKDTLYGKNGNDCLEGGAGHDRLYGQNGNDTLYGGLGNDTLTGGKGSDFFIYATGRDVITDFSADDTLRLGDGTDTYSKAISGSDIVLTVGNGRITLKDAASLETLNILGEEITPVETYNNGSASKVTLASVVEVGDASARTKSIRIMGNNIANTILGGTGKDTLYGKDGNDYLDGGAGNDRLYGQNGNDTLYGSSGNDTLTGGKGKDTFVCSNGDNIITDYQEGHDIIKLNSGFILDTSYDKNDVIFMVGGGTVTVKNGKGKSIAITDAFGNTTEKIYTPADSSTEPTEEEMLSTLHNVSRNGMKAFVTAFSEVDFQEMLDSAKETYEKDTVQYLQKVFDLSKELLESKIVVNSAAEDALFEQADSSNADNPDDSDESNEKILYVEDIKNKVDELKTYNGEMLAVESFLDSIGEYVPAAAGLKAALRTGNLVSTFIAAAIATDGSVMEDVDLTDELLDIWGDFVGDTLEDISGIEGVSGKTSFAAAIVTGIYNAVDDYKELKATDNVTFISDGEKFGHALSTFVVDGLAEEIPIIGTVFAFFPDYVKDAVRDEMADACITHSTVILDDTHGNSFKASPAVENIDARKRKNKIRIICQNNNTSVIGGAGDDTIRGDFGKDILRGGTGKDSIVGGAGNDMLFGDGNSDVLIGDYYDNNPYIKDKKNINNSGMDSHVYYKPSDFFGDDTLNGGTGNDTFIGGGGNDVIHCGGGKNLILYANGDGDDVVHNFTSTDTLHITSGDYKMSREDNDAIFTVGDGSITLKNVKGKVITVIDKDGKTSKKDFSIENDNIPNNALEHNGHSYCIFNINCTWTDAKNRCESMGGHLVTITDAQEQNAVERLMNSEEVVLTYAGYWMGGYNSGSWNG